jgi:hypothetical protein
LFGGEVSVFSSLASPFRTGREQTFRKGSKAGLRAELRD